MSKEQGPVRGVPPRAEGDPKLAGRGRFAVRADGRRAWAGRPALLALGWAVSCVLITAVTLTAVERVGREVSGSQDLLTAQGITKQVAAQAASASSASSFAPQPVSSAPAGHPTPSRSVAQPTTSSHPAPPKPSVSVSSPTPTASKGTPSPSPTATPPGTEYIFTCRDGKAVGGAVIPGTSPTPTPTPSVSVSVSVSVSPGVTPTPSPTTSPTPTPSSPSASPTASPSTSKSIIDVPGGRIVVACAGNSIANANATVSDSTYTLTVRSTSDPRVDVFLGKA